MESLLQIYELRVMETKPDKAVSIIECDMNVRAYCCKETREGMYPCCVLLLTHVLFSQVDFDAPLGYKEPERQPQHQEEPAVNPVFIVKLGTFQFGMLNITSFNCRRKKGVPTVMPTWTWDSE